MKVGQRRRRAHTKHSVLLSKEPIMKRHLGLSLHSKQKVLKCLLVLHPCSPLREIFWGKGWKQGRLCSSWAACWLQGQQEPSSIQALWSIPPAPSKCKVEPLGAPFPFPECFMVEWFSFISIFCPVFSLFEGVISPWTHYTCSSFLLKFFLCIDIMKECLKID